MRTEGTKVKDPASAERMLRKASAFETRSLCRVGAGAV